MYRKTRPYFRNYNSGVYDNVIKPYNLTNRRLIPEIINALKRLHFKFGHNKIIIDLERIERVSPYPTVPVAGYIHYFKEHLNVDFEFLNIPTYLRKIHFLSPDDINKTTTGLGTNFLDRIWLFHSSTDVHLLVNGFLSSIRKSCTVEEGILQACEWGLNEIMDNVIQHSSETTGFVMAQVLKDSQILKVSIFDYGQGIFESLRNSKYKPRNASDAISLAIQEGVTRDKKIGQGNGMWGLYNIINLNDGVLLITSGKGGLNYVNRVKTADSYNDIIMLSPKQQSTSINFDIKLNNPISMREALGGYEPIDLFIENLEDEFDRVVYRIIDQASGTGTRQSGERIRNEIMNIYRSVKKPVILDFEGIGIIASSFADELIGKLVQELGLFQFQAAFPMKNMNSTIQSIVQRSLSQRLSENINN
ncbi:MAG: STAS-like domain-containing protein [Bacteroidia bacterium]|nr:STAS-like domain-containing protein [Bacteroidia bacterium]